MKKKEKERYLLYGQLLVDFANANNAKDAFKSIVNNWLEANDCQHYSRDIEEGQKYYTNLLDQNEEKRQQADNLREQVALLLSQFIKNGKLPDVQNKPDKLSERLYLFATCKDNEDTHIMMYGFKAFSKELPYKEIEMPFITMVMHNSPMKIGDAYFPPPHDEYCHCEDLLAYCFTLFTQNFPKRLKQCPYCSRLFIANDSKKLHCYSEKCDKEYEKKKKQKQRNDDPVTYL